MGVGAKLSGLLALAVAAVTLQAGVAAAAGPPIITDTYVTAVKATNANLNADVDPNGFGTSFRFQYISAAAYEANLDAVPPKEGFAGATQTPTKTGQPVVEHVGGLAESTSYRYRVIASNLGGTTVGPTRPFTTGTSASTPFALLDARGWEMVSPVEKNGGQIDGPETLFGGGVFQAAAQGGAITYSSASSFSEPQGSPGASQYLSRRGTGGWSTENLTVAQYSGSYDVSPGAGVPYRLFSSDLDRALLTNGRRCRGEGTGCPVENPSLPGSGAPDGYRNYYLRDNGNGSFQALLTTTDLAGLTLGPDDFEVEAAATTPDLSQVVLSTCAALTGNAVEVPGSEGECLATATNLYLRSATGLELVNVLPGDTQGTPGAEIAAQSGAVSSDGSRVFFTVGGNLYLRKAGGTVQVDEAIGGGSSFETAGDDGSVAYLTKEGHLYRYLAATEALADLTPGGEVEGVLGASADGAYVYYLTTAGVFQQHAGAITPVAADADAGNYPPATGTARVGADGKELLFLSSANLTDFDSNGFSELYLWSTTAGLRCLSCKPSGEIPFGSSTVPGALANGEAFKAYKPRVLSQDGNRVFFESRDNLVEADTNQAWDVYEWEEAGTGSCGAAGGCLQLISTGRGGGGARLIDASADGDDVYFTTGESLVSGDPGGIDLYDARVGGGFPVPPEPIACLGDACQPLPSEPADPTPGTLLHGPGNPAPTVVKPKKKRKKHHRRHAKHRRGHGKHHKRGATGGHR